MKRNQVFLILAVLILVVLGITSCGASTTTSETTPTTAATNNVPGTSTEGRPTPPDGGTFSDNRSAPSIDWATAASKLGVSEEALQQAFTGTGQGMPDMTQIATKLGVTEEALREALGFTGNGPGDFHGGQPPTGTPPNGTPPNGDRPTDIPIPPTSSSTSGSATE
jgi:hypothetical protein